MQEASPVLFVRAAFGVTQASRSVSRSPSGASG